MSIYKVGLCCPTVGHAFEKQEYQIGALVATPGFIRDQVNALNAEIMAHDRDIAKQAGLPGFGGEPNPELENWWRANWIPFMESWSRFRNEHQSWTSNLWGSTLESVNGFRNRLIDMRKAAEKAGFEFGAATPRPPEEGWMADLASGIAGIGRFVRNVVYVLLALAGGWLVYKAFVVHRGGSPRLLAA